MLMVPLPSSADVALENAIDKNPPYTAFVFLVNGFRGCCVPGGGFRESLTKHGAYVHESNWNQIDRKGNPGVPMADPKKFAWKVTPSPPDDERFIEDMKAVIKKITAKHPSMPIILIGHSFGGDALLQVGKRIEGRKIAFLAVLDGVGRGGLRKNITNSVPSNVDYFFNRWQENPPILGHHFIPFDTVLSGELKSHARESNQGKQNNERNKDCKTKYRDPLKMVPQILSHGEVPKDSCIQHKIIEILEARVLK